MKEFKGSPEELLAAAKALVDHNHDGSDASDILFDMLLFDLRKSIKAYDKRFDPSSGADFEKLMKS